MEWFTILELSSFQKAFYGTAFVLSCFALMGYVDRKSVDSQPTYNVLMNNIKVLLSTSVFIFIGTTVWVALSFK